MKYHVYQITNKVGDTYYGYTADPVVRWEKHRHKKDGVVRKLINGGDAKFTIIETYDTEDEARLTEALLIEMFECVNLKGEITAVAIEPNEYFKNYRRYKNDIFNKMGTCPHCEMEMISRNLPRHYGRCKALRKTILQNYINKI